MLTQRGVHCRLHIALRPLIALLALSCLGIALAPSAHATVWKANGTKFTNGQSASTTRAMAPETSMLLKGTVAGTPVELKATGLEGVETKITQSGTGEAGLATESGKFKFTGVSVLSPAGCGVSSTLTTTALTGEAKMSKNATTELIQTYVPTSGTTLMTIPITGCAIAGTYTLKTGTSGLPCERKDKTTLATEKLVLECKEALVTLEKAQLELAGAAADLGFKFLAGLVSTLLYDVEPF